MPIINQNSLPNPGNQAQSTTPQPSTSPEGFQSGNGANITAILALIAAMMKLVNDKNVMYASQAILASHVSNDLSESQVELGKTQMTEKVVEGSLETVGGLGAGYGSVQNEREESKLQPLKDDAEGSQEFMNNLKHNPDESLTDQDRVESPEVKDRLEELISKVKSGEVQLNDGKKASNLTQEDQEFVDTLSKPQFDKFKGAVQEQVDAKGQRFAEAKKTLEANMTKRKGWSDSFSSITGGAGKINSGIMQAQQEAQRADNTQYETAKKQFESLENETEKQGDQDLQSAQSLLQLISELDKSNNAILSA